MPPVAWHALDPNVLKNVARAVATSDEAGAAAVPAYVRSRLPLLTAAGVDKRVGVTVTLLFPSRILVEVLSCNNPCQHMRTPACRCWPASTRHQQSDGSRPQTD